MPTIRRTIPKMSPGYIDAMKRLVLFIIALCIVGCASTRKASSSVEKKTEDKTELDVMRQKTKDSAGRTEVRTETDTDQQEQREVIVREYDPNKPIDRETGTPPLVRETTVRTQRKKTEEKRETARTESEVCESDSLVDRTKNDVLTQENTSEKVKMKRSTPWWVYACGIVVAVGVFVFIRARLSKFHFNR